MNTLLNRFAWGIAILLWFLTSSIIFSWFWLYYGWGLWSILYWIPFILLIKRFIFWEQFISEKLSEWSKKAIATPVYESKAFEQEQTRIEKIEKIEEIIEVEEKQEIEKIEVEYKEEEYKSEYKEEEPSAFDIYMEKVGIYIKEFFATNTLAKIGGILLFMGVVYFLKWVAGSFWESIGPVWRLIVWFIIGFSTFWTGTLLHAKWNKNEGLILIWLSILINYAVILSGRYLIGENMSGWDGFLREGVTFGLLILNTIFWVVTSLVYNSRTLLIFSFVFAYLNPFIIWAESSGQPYTLIWYSFIISLGWLFLAERDKNMLLVFISFILWNLLFLAAPFSDSLWWNSKIILTSILSLLSIILANKNTGEKSSFLKLWDNSVVYLFWWTYLFVALHLLNSGNYLSERLSFFVYIIILIGLCLFSIKLILSDKKEAIGTRIFLFFPLIILFWLVFTDRLLFSPFVLAFTLIFYLFAFNTLQNKLSELFSYILFWVLWAFVFLFITSTPSLILIDGVIDVSHSSIIFITAFIFLLSSYYFSTKKNLSKLYSIGTIWTIALLFVTVVTKQDLQILEPQIVFTNTLEIISVIAIIIFALANWALPFINKNLLEDRRNIWNLIAWSLAGVLFLAFEIYNFWEVYFSKTAEWLAFGGLAIVYFIQSFFIVQKIGAYSQQLTNNEGGNIQDESLRNVFYSYAWISVSLFSLAIAFVFSEYPEIISTVWLFEATILYYFYSQNKENKILFAWNILFAIWIFKLWLLLDVVQKEDYKFLVSFGVIAASLLLNIRFIDSLKDRALKIFHYIFHIIGIGILAGLLFKIIVSNGHGWSSFWIASFVSIIWFFYRQLQVEFLKWFFVIVLGVFAMFHIWEIEHIFRRLTRDDLEYLKIIQYIVTAMLVTNYFIWKTQSFFNKIVVTIISVYAFIISNIYILDIFGDMLWHFSLTIYWWVIASVLLFYGISKDAIKYRTIGLYFIILTTLKIIYDVFFWFDDSWAKIAAFMGLWILFITISTLYTKKYGNNIFGELNFDNLKTPLPETTPIQKEEKTNKVDKESKDDNFMEKLEWVNVDNIKVIRFIPVRSKKFTIRAKNLLRVTKLVTKQFWKNKFEAGELSSVYSYIIKHYKTKLSRREYDKIRTTIKEFIDEGGEVEVVKK